jgi:glucoamylase
VPARSLDTLTCVSEGDFSAFEPGLIGDYALLSDLRSAALVGRNGSIDWLCLPRFDSASCFARLIGGDGHWRIAPSGHVTEVHRRYVDDSLVLETEFHTPDGVVRLTDAMPPATSGADAPAVVRVLEGVSGQVEMTLRWVVRFAYGHSTPWVRRVRESEREYILALAGPHAVTLHGEKLPSRREDERAHEMTFTLSEGETSSWVMAYCPAPEAGEVPDFAALPDLAGARTFWRAWTDQIAYDGPHAAEVCASLTVLKGLTYQPTGGIVAAPTTSLPETVGGNRNWDYRYCWLRDATLTLLAFDNFGFTAEATAWRRWLLRSVAGDPADLQIMYGIDGFRHLWERELDWLSGYRGSTPVRVGNAAWRQLQLDVYGEVMDALHLARERGCTEQPETWALQRGLMGVLEKIWQSPDKGLWEVRGPDRFFTYSRVMIWVAFDRAVRAVEEDGLPGPVEHWRDLRDQVREEVLAQAWNPDVGAFTQYYGGTELDASVLRLPAVGFLPGDDERMLATIEAIGRELKRGDLVDRYSTSESSDSASVDGLTGREGSFLMCSFWYVDALALSGRSDEAEAMFERLLELRNDVGLLAEEYDPHEQCFLGNFPQAFSHLALVNSAAVLYGSRSTREQLSRRNGGVLGAR